ncbi:unnamed protein product [Spirodela intermedia]|uniref:Uncharacterized protein n=2 Tax=Spirodela intermedia TaxID=51605 RepID=A0A7I8IAW7_SPIIN|nr:unnamed protein product [Spirodela intermedia]CAA6654031.1 unnamed protein product [Spirodela intermedia]CAA6674099.1 unnamed protein product [Spirodela intermedia]CAA6674279.1 unnamed protein product [Spirodela intermedia]CAA6674280.1 unnamed protein product [Spirodela intermedia]
MNGLLNPLWRLSPLVERKNDNFAAL